jgi:uncharacterized membrane protein YccC
MSRAGGAAPALLFGLRLWTAVSVALFVAFYLQFDNAQWAATSAAIVCQPTLGASLRRATFRLTGTSIGAVATVVLAAVFPQSPWGFLVGLALWGAGCGYFAAIFRDNWSYAAGLAGLTATIIASDALSSTGLAGNAIFMLAIDRAGGICIGIICAGIVLSLTDMGGARHRLSCQIAAVASEIMGRFVDSLSLVGPEQLLTQPIRRGLIGRVVGLGPVIDETIGETAGLRYRLPLLRSAVDGLFAALAGWRTVANSLERMPAVQGHREAAEVLGHVPLPMRAAPADIKASSWVREPAQLAHAARGAVRRLVALPADTPTLRLMADATAEALLGLARTLDGLVLLANLSGPVPRKHAAHYVGDTLPAWITAARVFVTIGAVELFWVVTAWPTGALAITFAAIAVILLSPREGMAYAAAQVFMLGITLGTVLAGTIKFALLPQLHSFAGLCLAIGLVLVPVGALSFQPWQSQVFTVTATVFFIPLLDPANVMTYDTQQFYNSTVAVFAGVGAAMVGLVLLPPLSPEARSRRLLALTCRDMHRLAAGHLLSAASDWEGRIYGRVSALTATPNPLQLAQIVALHSIGTEIIRLRHIAPRIGLSAELEPAFAAIAEHDSAAAIRHLAQIDRRLVTMPSTRSADVLRARGSIRVIEQALAQHGTFIDTGG